MLRCGPLLVLFTLLGSACDGGPPPELTPEDEAMLVAMRAPARPPPSPTNRLADDDEAAALGRLLFFDERMSADGRVSCASCHDPDQGFSDPRARSLGVEEREGHRHSMPVTMLGEQRFLFWDGRADSGWSQPLQAIESEREMDFTRVEVARLAAERYGAAYEAIFGPLPATADLPARARPGMPAWDALDPVLQDAVNRAFANVGKALEAYQRRLTCDGTRFDAWTAGEVELTAGERAGAARFVQIGCIDCHSGPAFSDGEFHNIGIGSGLPEPDLGREAATAGLRENPFNGAGAYSDDPEAGAALLDDMAVETGTLGAFRTASLRGVGQRRFFGHRGHEEDLDDFIDDVYDRPNLQDSAVGELDPDVVDLEADGIGDIVDFLRTLDCPPPPAELLAPTSR